MDIIKSALEKWEIPYVDLRYESNLMLVDGLTEKYFCNGDGTHPTKEAYDIFYVPAIEAKLKTL